MSVEKFFREGMCKSTILVDGIPAAQHPNAIESFDKLARSYPNIKTIIEIGTLFGGFSLFLGKYSEFGEAKVITYDIKKPEKSEEIKKYCDLRIKDCFSEGGKEIIDLINLSERSLILCDGGNKINEFNFFGKYLKEGDIIMAHDYWHSQEYVTERGWEKAWGREIEYKHIKETCEKFNLTPILRDDMERSYWACFIKNKI